MNQDPTAKQRKKDHIDLALTSEVLSSDERFYYEPMLAPHPQEGITKTTFLNKPFALPIWISSMTGGTEWAKTINVNLAKAAKEFGLGMGLGSCRSLLYDDERISDFAVREYIGDQPLYANLGIAQLEELVAENRYQVLQELIKKLDADGLIIHVNPLQEGMQPEGDLIKVSPLDTIKNIIDHLDIPLIVKEVGQGMGYRSLEALLKLPLAAVDFAAHGGTNFTKLELLRTDDPTSLDALTRVGHSASEMVHMVNQISEELGSAMLCQQIIISGGVKDFLDGYYLMETLKTPSIYGQAGAFLKHARGEYEALRQYILSQKKGLEMAYAFLQVK